MTSDRINTRPLHVSRRGVSHPLHWGAVLAGLAVGMAAHLVFLLIGAAAALPVFDPAQSSASAGAAFFAGVWGVASMLVSTLVGGYVAARATGLRRTGDGVIHGAVLWGTTTLLLAGFAVSAPGRALGGLFTALARFDATDPRSAAETGWLAAMIMLALLAAVAGGATGIRAGRRLERRSLSAVGAAARPVATPGGTVRKPD